MHPGRGDKSSRASSRLTNLRTAGTLPISSDYHHQQAATLTQLARTTRDPDTAKALLLIAAEHRARAEEASRTTPLGELVARQAGPMLRGVATALVAMAAFDLYFLDGTYTHAFQTMGFSILRFFGH